MSFGERLRRRRKELGIPIQALAEKVGKDRATIYRYEKGDIRAIPYEVMERLSEALDVTSEYMLGLSEDPHGHGTNDYYLPELLEAAEIVSATLKRNGEEQKGELLALLLRKSAGASPEDMKRIISIIEVFAKEEDCV